MLTHITIRDFAIVDHLELDLNTGMTVLTGETGAGKSILVDALGLVLGNRADSGVVRHGCERAEIGAAFDAEGMEDVRRWLAEHELDAGGECLLRRSVTAEGRSRGYINGRPVPLQLLQELGEKLVDIHGQHEHQSLLKSDIQLRLLDDYAGHGEHVSGVEKTWRQWKKLSAELEELRRAAHDRDARLELLRYQAGELEALELGEGELTLLDEEHARLANAGRLIHTVETALHNLYESDEGAALTVLDRTLGELEQLRAIDSRLAAACELLNNALIQIGEGANELRHYRESLDLDPERLQWVEQRLDAIHQLARKHRIPPAELPALLARSSEELAAIERSDERLADLQKELETLARRYREQARELGASRARAAHELSERVTAAMRPLGLPHAHFEITLHPLDEERFSPTGMERAEFLVNTNPGQPLKPLNKVASGGELSRISLAIQVITARSQHIPTLIFDEVDTGIGGGVAESVGRQLRTLGESHQVLCVTHLPQVAALGHHHLHVSKQTKQNSTATRIQVLTKDTRQEEIARMLGGVEITDQTRAHAKEMIARAQKRRG
ncbi:MAG: DNA repair protein RecN [Pseudomonadota bacterium]